MKIGLQTSETRLLCRNFESKRKVWITSATGPDFSWHGIFTKAMTPRIDPRIARFRLRVGRSRIHRCGVFALEDIPAGRHVIEYTGKRISVAQANKIGFPRNRYLATLSDRWVADPSVGGSGAEIINHSCNPNLKWRRIRGRLFYFSRRRIRVAEELTADYAYPLNLRRVRCRCGARNCRGTLRYVLSQRPNPAPQSSRST